MCCVDLRAACARSLKIAQILNLHRTSSEESKRNPNIAQSAHAVHVGPRPQLRGRRGHVGAEPDGGALRGAGAAFTSFHECDRGRKQVLVL